MENKVHKAFRVPKVYRVLKVKKAEEFLSA
jgi:hypothetical protein